MKLINKNKKGFTLIELMIVLAILAMLAAIVLASIQRARERARYTGCIANMRSIAVAIEIYITEDPLDFPPDDINKLVPDYTHRLPKNFKGVDYGYIYDLVTHGYTMFCPGLNHELFGAPEDYPRFTSDSGVLEKPI